MNEAQGGPQTGISSDFQAGLTALGMDLQQAAVRLAAGVNAAYVAYNNGSNNAPQLDGYTILQPIYVFESDPNVFPGAGAEAGGLPAAAVEAMRQPSEYADGGSQAALGTPSPGKQLFGFTAIDNARTHFMLALRGTVTAYEAYIDLFGWGKNTRCLLPSQWYEKSFYGNVNSYLYDFYTSYDDVELYSLAYSCMQAIQKSVAAYPSLDLQWLAGAHSLGGAVVSLAALDGRLSGVFGKRAPGVITFGSLHVGDASFAAHYGRQLPDSIRIANLCDFVPAMVSLLPVVTNPPYVHVGTAYTFVWQTWDDWGNHSLVNIYQPVVKNYWNVIKIGTRTYPQ